MNNHPPLTFKDGLLSGSGKPSWFGTKADKAQDSGIGSTGFNSLTHPHAPYISLPIVYWKLWKLVPFQKFTVELVVNGEIRQVETFLSDKGPGGTPEADSRLVDVGPSVANRLMLTDNPYDITDHIVQIYSRQQADGTWPVVPKEKRY